MQKYRGVFTALRQRAAQRSAAGVSQASAVRCFGNKPSRLSSKSPPSAASTAAVVDIPPVNNAWRNYGILGNLPYHTILCRSSGYL